MTPFISNTFKSSSRLLIQSGKSGYISVKSQDRAAKVIPVQNTKCKRSIYEAIRSSNCFDKSDQTLCHTLQNGYIFQKQTNKI